MFQICQKLKRGLFIRENLLTGFSRFRRIYKIYLLTKIAAERFGMLTRIMLSWTSPVRLTPRRSINLVCGRLSGETLNSIVAASFKLLITIIAALLLLWRPYAYWC